MQFLVFGFRCFSMADNRPIGLFDSGVGLISVLIEIKKLLPLENYVVYADQGNNPYGEKSKEQIRKYASEATRYLIDKNGIKMMVLACNTATVLVLDSLRKKFEIPIIGVVPAVKPAFEESNKKNVAVMSTPATAKSEYLAKLVSEFSKSGKALKIGCAGLEEAIEILDYKKIDFLLKKFTARVKNFGADVLVLGCTHYPLVKSRLRGFLGKDVKIVDSGKAIASRVKLLLADSDSLSKKKGSDVFYTTGDPLSLSAVASVLLNSKVKVQSLK